MPSSISTRESIQWLPDEAGERSITVVLSSPGSRFVDLRPVIPSIVTPEESEFPFEWAFAGYERVLKGDYSIMEFTHDFFDSSYIYKYQLFNKNLLSEKPLLEDISADIGYFETIGIGRRRETGKMANSANGDKITDYVEIWQSLNPIKFTPTEKAILHEDTEEGTTEYGCYVYDIVGDDNKELYEGRVIRVGNWIQGLVWDKSDKTSKVPISAIRLWFDKSKGNWVDVHSFGNLKSFENFPIFNDFKIVNVNSEFTTSDGNITWTCVEVEQPSQ
ncbi:unnamed protein product [[Candida] boidinii]|uniref:Protein HRI1 n=1 Tax=Candida boidinii TaxID=5477 RepID=A0A9W6T3J3_CANBO|nr:hypothetical protein B5S30_g3849 [[Candida] boidinii]OWB84711.1 hypothetical protein B5S33_g3361 [[Candida] boidinii]GME73535.1 unnamed protein product [[Candida] boidinii]GMG15793.1 unnamed protein product [[Candida] boidinii]